MAYSEEEKILKYAQAMADIEEFCLYFIEDIVAYLGISKDSFYNWWPLASDEYKEMTDALNSNKVKTKVLLRQKMAAGRSSDVIALYKIIGTDDERKKLSQTFLQVGGDQLPQEDSEVIDLGELSTDTLLRIEQESGNIRQSKKIAEKRKPKKGGKK